MQRYLGGLVAALALWTSAGCGSPASSYDNCRASCDASFACGYSSAVDHTSCLTSCDNTKGTLSDLDNQLAMKCKNAAAILDANHSCYVSTPCGNGAALYNLQVISCKANAPACQ